ncbi:class I SAM-dependent methyltransferase [Acidimicrobiia bacterium EGI L10123]|uniref:class I SAM-dependent methyltransferase n=1 Tax=Salinilacustrithrix flava TaxID=2957203 RepID=UPI003D7C265F|nr:class I SAM-dependent methyltransferase [Acidimicrobiia bacterium EGI L10123]
MTIAEHTTAAPAPSDLELAVEETVASFVDAVASAAFISMVAIGDRLGLYGALADLGGATAGDLAATSGCNERLVLEWLSCNASAGYVDHVVDDRGDDRFTIGPAAAALLADEGSPVFLASAATLVRSYFTDQDQLESAFRGSGGIDWGDHHDCMFTAVERFYGNAYSTSLTSEWIPSVPGLAEKLTAGASVADVGCGHGVSTALMAEAYPQSTFHGFDFHDGSIRRAREVAVERGVTSNVQFSTRTATDFDGGPYDVVCVFDALHDMGDPGAVIRHARSLLADDGVVLLVEAQAGDDRATSIANPLGRLFYAASTVLCTPCALSQGGPEALGNQVGAARWEQIFVANGFSRFERSLETPFNLILAARP